MSKNVLVISTSLRKNSNSEQLVAAFADGAREAGHDVEVLSLRDKTLGFCCG
ncbi:MAG: NAD(P)H-dependent oxidoreductase, partial [Selenomonas sp.]